MSPTGNSPIFGGFPEPRAADTEEIFRVVRLWESWNLDLVGIQDHPYQAKFLDTLSLLSALAARTERITLFTDVANLPLRPPAILAKTAATIDIISGGRFELGLGAGAMWEAVAAMGGPDRSRGGALDALREAISIIREMWGEAPSVRITGEHYSVSGVHPGPRPAHDIGIWIGGYGNRMMQLIGELADGWVPSSPYAPPEKLVDRIEILDESIKASGRLRSDVRRIYNISGRIQDQSEGFLTGPPEQWVDEIGSLIDLGMDGFVLWPSAPADAQMQRFAMEVVPRMRELYPA